MAKKTLILQRILKPCFRAFFRICARVRVAGMENLPAQPPYIVFSNHISWFDPLLVGAFIPVPIHFMAMEGLFKFPPLGFILRKVGAFPVGRGTLDRRAIEDAIDILSQKGVVFIFPEGGIGRIEKGEKMRAGISLIAQRAGVAMVPVGISGCRDLYNPLKIVTRRVKITLRAGKPFLMESISKLEGKKMRMAAMERVKKELCALAV